MTNNTPATIEVEGAGAVKRMTDSKGIPIYPGDLLRSPHFIGARRKQYYLYHVAVSTERGMDMVPTCHLEESKIKGGGRCFLSEDMAKQATIIHGHGPEPCLDFTDRKTTP